MRDPSRLHRGGYQLRRTRARILARYGPRCWRCGGEIDLTVSGNDPAGLTLGHIRPVSKGGTDDDANLAPEHNRCNVGARAREISPAATIARPIGRE